ncbi:MAG TPA: phage head closure protein, partial [Fervidobacterium sp.]|nr:phage head closure protein [Fervidobacterium sp.]
MINPGKLNQRIKIYKTGTGYDDYGEPLDGKEVVHECWASVKNKSGTEQFKSVTPFSKVVTSFLIRYTKKAIDTTMKIEFQGEEYNI